MGHVLAGSIIALSDNLKVGYSMMVVQGVVMTGRCFVGYAWITECISLEDAPKITAGMFTFDALTIFFASLYFKYISKNWVYFYATPLAILALTVALYFFLEETPKWLYAVGQYDRARGALTAIGRWNGKLDKS